MKISKDACLCIALLVVSHAALASDSLSDVRSPRLPPLPSPAPYNQTFLNNQMNTEELDCCERWYVNHSWGRWFHFWDFLRCCCRCISAGVVHDESCGMCTCCDFAEGSTRQRREREEQGVEALEIGKQPVAGTMLSGTDRIHELAGTTGTSGGKETEV